MLLGKVLNQGVQQASKKLTSVQGQAAQAGEFQKMMRSFSQKKVQQVEGVRRALPQSDAGKQLHHGSPLSQNLVKLLSQPAQKRQALQKGVNQAVKDRYLSMTPDTIRRTNAKMAEYYLQIQLTTKTISKITQAVEQVSRGS